MLICAQHIKRKAPFPNFDQLCEGVASKPQPDSGCGFDPAKFFGYLAASARARAHQTSPTGAVGTVSGAADIFHGEMYKHVDGCTP